MSRIGKLGIKIPNGTEVKVDGSNVNVKGPKGELSLALIKGVKLSVENNEAFVQVSRDDSKDKKSLQGLFRSLLNNMVIGVNNGFEKKLEVKGVGYRMALAGDKINFNLGYSHPIEFPLPAGISANIEGNNNLTISGIDKQLVGEVAAQIRKLRAPEPYKGKGIKYSDEIIRRKAGKTATK